MKQRLFMLLDWTKSFFNEDGASTARAMCWVWTVTFCIALLFCVVFNGIKTHEAKLPDITYSYVVLTGIYMGAKVGQRIWGEGKTNTTITSTTTNLWNRLTGTDSTPPSGSLPS